MFISKKSVLTPRIEGTNIFLRCVCVVAPCSGHGKETSEAYITFAGEHVLIFWSYPEDLGFIATVSVSCEPSILLWTHPLGLCESHYHHRRITHLSENGPNGPINPFWPCQT